MGYTAGGEYCLAVKKPVELLKNSERCKNWLRYHFALASRITTSFIELLLKCLDLDCAPAPNISPATHPAGTREAQGVTVVKPFFKPFMFSPSSSLIRLIAASTAQSRAPRTPQSGRARSPSAPQRLCQVRLGNRTATDYGAELPAAYNTAALQSQRGKMPRLHNSHTHSHRHCTSDGVATEQRPTMETRLPAALYSGVF